MRFTYLVSKPVPPLGPREATTIPQFPDTGATRRDADADAALRSSAETGGQDEAGPPIAGDVESVTASRVARRPGLSSPDPRHPSFTAISWVVLQEVKHDAATALLRLELLRRQHPASAIARATEFLRCAVGELDALAAGESDGDDSDSNAAGGLSSRGRGPTARG